MKTLVMVAVKRELAEAGATFCAAVEGKEADTIWYSLTDLVNDVLEEFLGERKLLPERNTDETR